MARSGKLHVIFGTGPAAAATGQTLVAHGWAVRFVNRSGERTEFLPPEAEVARADARDRSATLDAAQGAETIHNCLNVPYQRWAALLPPMQRSLLKAARAASVRLVSLENLYGYGEVPGAIREELPLDASTKKGSLRAEMAETLWEAHRKGDVRVAIGRASDFYGPGVTNSFLGQRAFRPIVEGKPAQVFGNPDLPHSYAYIQDVGGGLATLGWDDSAVGQAWHLPHAAATTTREMLNQAFQFAGSEPSLRVVRPWMLRIVGLFVPEARESIELLYEFTNPFVVDDSKFRGQFAQKPTPLATGIRETVNWYQQRFG